MPGKKRVGVHTVGGARSPKRERRLLAIVIDDHAVAAVERPFPHGFEKLKSRDHGARGQDLDFEVAAGHIIDLLGEIVGELVEDVLGRPGRLPAHSDRPLGLENRRETNCRRTPCGHRRLKDASAGDLLTAFFELL